MCSFSSNLVLYADASTGECVTLMIRSIWASYDNVPNSMPSSSGTTTRDFVSFFLFWACSLPAIWFPVHKIRHLFTAKAYFVPPAGVAFFIWSIVKAHGIGPIVHQGSTKSGGALGWAIVQGIMSSIANFATMIVSYFSKPNLAQTKQNSELLSMTREDRMFAIGFVTRNTFRGQC